MNAPWPRRFALAAAMLAALAANACRSGNASHQLHEQDYPGTLQPAAALRAAGVWQQHVTASWPAPDGSHKVRGFDAAVQRRGDQLTIIGLSPMGSIGFAIELGPDGIDVTNHMQEQLRIPPRFILLDVQRTFFPWLGDDAARVVAADGATTLVGTRDGERILERRAPDGSLLERQFERLDAQPAGQIRIRYEWGDAGWSLPRRAVFENDWFGYRLEIVTHAETRLDEERSAQ